MLDSNTVDKKNRVKLLICYHKPSYLFKDEVLTPIHVGRANAIHRMDHESDSFKWLMEKKCLKNRWFMQRDFLRVETTISGGK